MDREWKYGDKGLASIGYFTMMYGCGSFLKMIFDIFIGVLKGLLIVIFSWIGKSEILDGLI